MRAVIITDHLAEMPPLEDIANSVVSLVSSEGNWIEDLMLRANGSII